MALIGWVAGSLENERDLHPSALLTRNRKKDSVRWHGDIKECMDAFAIFHPSIRYESVDIEETWTNGRRHLPPFFPSNLPSIRPMWTSGRGLMRNR